MIASFYKFQAKGRDVSVNKARASMVACGTPFPKGALSSPRTAPVLPAIDTSVSSIPHTPAQASSTTTSSVRQQLEHLSTVFPAPSVSRSISGQGLHPELPGPRHAFADSHRMFDALLSEGGLYTISPPESVGMEVEPALPAIEAAAPTALKKRKRKGRSTEDGGVLGKGKGNVYSC